MARTQYTTEDIAEFDECPICGLCDRNWLPYNCPEEKEVGLLCTECNTHFVDINGSNEEYG